ncbi:hypothetical protein MHYP_G00320920 [Metynnis hypsauchen]
MPPLVHCGVTVGSVGLGKPTRVQHYHSGVCPTELRRTFTELRMKAPHPVTSRGSDPFYVTERRLKLTSLANNLLSVILLSYHEIRRSYSQHNRRTVEERSSSYSSSALDYEREHKLAPVFDSPRMSRRSLRLNASTSHYRDDSLLDSSQSCSISYSAGGSVHRENKTFKSRRSRSTTSGSGSQLQTPVKNQSNSVLQAHNSSLHSFAASDASLLSSLLDESCVQKRTLIDSVWGLDEDEDLKDRSLRTDRSYMSTAQTQTFTVTSGYICKDCTAGSSDNRDALPTYSSSKPCSSSSCSYSSSTSALHNDARDGASSPYTTVYSREKSRRHRSALLWSVTGWCASLCKKVASSSAAALTLLTRSAGLRGASSVNANGGFLCFLTGTRSFSAEMIARSICGTCSGLTAVRINYRRRGEKTPG